MYNVFFICNLFIFIVILVTSLLTSKVLREEIQRSRGGEGRRRSHVHTTMSQLAHQEREQFISQMEELSAKVSLPSSY